MELDASFRVCLNGLLNACWELSESERATGASACRYLAYARATVKQLFLAPLNLKPSTLTRG